MTDHRQRAPRKSVRAEGSEQGWRGQAARPEHCVAAARGLAELALRHGKRRARESKWYRPVFAAIRFLGGRERQRRAILSRAKVLLNACEETSIFPEILTKPASWSPSSSTYHFLPDAVALVCTEPRGTLKANFVPIQYMVGRNKIRRNGRSRINEPFMLLPGVG
jgi:hypothetical protein